MYPEFVGCRISAPTIFLSIQKKQVSLCLDSAMPYLVQVNIL